MTEYFCSKFISNTTPFQKGFHSETVGQKSSLIDSSFIFLRSIYKLIYITKYPNIYFVSQKNQKNGPMVREGPMLGRNRRFLKPSETSWVLMTPISQSSFHLEQNLRSCFLRFVQGETGALSCDNGPNGPRQVCEKSREIPQRHWLAPVGQPDPEPFLPPSVLLIFLKFHLNNNLR